MTSECGKNQKVGHEAQRSVSDDPTTVDNDLLLLRHPAHRIYLLLDTLLVLHFAIPVRRLARGYIFAISIGKLENGASNVAIQAFSTLFYFSVSFLKTGTSVGTFLRTCK